MDVGSGLLFCRRKADTGHGPLGGRDESVDGGCVRHRLYPARTGRSRPERRGQLAAVR